VQEKGTTPFTVTGTTDQYGNLYFDGLSAGSYTLTEITAPSGYSLLADPISIVIGWTAPTDLTVTNPLCTWTYTVNGVASTSLDQYGRDIVTIKNVPSNELPSTGGMGTTLFTIGGLVVMAGAALVLVIRRKGTKAGK
jgi:LPXTG-motif cell wall-anchored protein